MRVSLSLSLSLSLSIYLSIYLSISIYIDHFMEQTYVNYSFKNIPIPNKHLYNLVLLKKLEKFISNKK